MASQRCTHDSEPMSDSAPYACMHVRTCQFIYMYINFLRGADKLDLPGSPRWHCMLKTISMFMSPTSCYAGDWQNWYRQGTDTISSTPFNA